MHSSKRKAITILAAAAVFSCLVADVATAWTVVPRGDVVLDTSAVSGVVEMSGVTYLGLQDGEHEFAAVQDSNNQLVRFTANFTANGTIQSAVASSVLSLSPGADFEGIAYTNPARNSVFISEETTPAVREYSLASGLQLQLVLPPTVYSSIANNRGLESLTRSIGGRTMWTANEEALTIDGSLATGSAGTTVRLQQFDVDGNMLTATSQYAYEVDPIPSSIFTNRSGLVDMLALPDGTMLALERSLSAGFESRIYKIGFAGATDTSDPEFDSGLSGKAYTSVSKTELWTGGVGGGIGKNLEGLALGPRLAEGGWLLLGVVDGGVPNGDNTVATFQAIPPTCDLDGDYNCSGEVDAMDYAAWSDTFGSSELAFADGNNDGSVNLADYTVWRDNLGSTSSQSAALSQPSRVPEPRGWIVLFVGIGLSVSLATRGDPHRQGIVSFPLSSKKEP